MHHASCTRTATMPKRLPKNRCWLVTGTMTGAICKLQRLGCAYGLMTATAVSFYYTNDMFDITHVQRPELHQMATKLKNCKVACYICPPKKSFWHVAAEVLSMAALVSCWMTEDFSAYLSLIKAVCLSCKILVVMQWTAPMHLAEESSGCNPCQKGLPFSQIPWRTARTYSQVLARQAS